jgi:hypothetical protein
LASGEPRRSCNRNKSLFASFSSEKEDSSPSYEEKEILQARGLHTHAAKP